MPRLLLIIAFAVVCNTSDSVSPDSRENEAAAGYSGAIRNTENEILKLMRKQHLPALAMTIVDGDEVIYQNAFGLTNLEKNIRATTRTVFKLWSVSKVFTAIEIFREVESGIIDLDCPISEYLPEFMIQSRFEDENPVTVRSLLAHRSGLPRNGCVIGPEKEPDTQWLFRFEKSASDCFQAYPVGFRYKYSNLGYDLLGRIIEQNRNQGFARYMNENLLADLGMENSSFLFSDISPSDSLALGYEYYKGNYYPRIQSGIDNLPSGNLYSTIEDLSCFMLRVFRNEVFDKNETMAGMYVDYYSTPADPETMGLGWKTTYIDGTELVVWHDGGPGEGTGALIALMPERKMGMAMMANSTSFAGSVSMPFAIEVFNRMLSAKAPGHEQSGKPVRYGTSQKHLMKFEGTYAAFGQPMNVEARKKKLKASIGNMKLDLIPISENAFRVTHWMEAVGLTKIIKPPVAFEKISIEFRNAETADSCYMIIALGVFSHEICPRYPKSQKFEDMRNSVEGAYSAARRLPGNSVGKYTGSKYVIREQDSVLMMSGVYGPVVPIDESHLIISSGPFAGETMEYDARTGHLIHQNHIFVPSGSPQPGS